MSVGTLRWYDTHHEAVSPSLDADWTSEKVMDFSWHFDIKSLLRYRHPKSDQTVARLRAVEPNRSAVLSTPCDRLVVRRENASATNIRSFPWS